MSGSNWWRHRSYDRRELWVLGNWHHICLNLYICEVFRKDYSIQTVFLHRNNVVWVIKYANFGFPSSLSVLASMMPPNDVSCWLSAWLSHDDDDDNDDSNNDNDDDGVVHRNSRHPLTSFKHFSSIVYILLCDPKVSFGPSFIPWHLIMKFE